MKKYKVLLAEDDSSLAFVVKDNLEDKGFDVVHAENGENAWQSFQRNKFDICLLDVNMPVRDGFSVAKKIREQTDITPIVFITARSMEEDKVKGFQIGADDYLIKPFSVRELVMRMDVFLRRSKRIELAPPEKFRIGKTVLMYNELKIIIHREVRSITQREADLLMFFVSHPGRILKRDEILLNVWGKDDYFLGRSMDVFITRLRRYLKADTSLNLETVYGVGFRLNGV